jgi:crossover junction endodeoxyribonuclease RuvC
MRILGIDPGLGCTGYGIIERRKKLPKGTSNPLKQEVILLEAGIIRTPTKEKLPKRLKKIYNAVFELIREYKPDVLVLEELYSFYKNPSTAIKMAHARGVITLAAAVMNVEVAGYAALKVKKAITGAGRARKNQMQRVIREMLNLKDEPAPHDIADALALALTHMHIIKRKL